MHSTYYSDRKLETEVHKFLIKHKVYEQLFNGHPETVEDARLQKLGADVIIGNTVVDEKAAVAWAGANSCRRNFAAEYYNFTSHNPGWIIRPNVITTHYLQIFIYLKDFYTNEDRRTNRKFKCDDILALDLLLIDKEKFKEYVSSKLSDDVIMAELTDMHERGIKYKLVSGIELRVSYALHEVPAMITVSADKLESVNVANKYYVYHAKGTVFDGFYVGDVKHEPSDGLSS